MSSSRSVDLNADVGESYGAWTLGDDAGLLAVVTSANIACGFHAGDPTTLLRTCRLAVEQDVVIGAQVAYPDLAGFGRRFVDVAPDDLYADVLYQVGALDGIARAVGGRVAYVKPHGALYNAVVHHQAQAAAVAQAVASYDPDLPVLGLPGSAMLRAAADLELRPVAEAFADRAYTAHGTLVPRTEPGAVLHDPEQVAARVVRLVVDARLLAADGNDIGVAAESVCLHGDTAGAVAMAHAVREALDAAGVTVRAFAR